MVRRNVESIIPQAKGFNLVIAYASKDIKGTLARYERYQTGYDEMPRYIVCYQNDELYITSVKCPSVKFMNPDPSFIIHMPVQNVAKVETGAFGKVSIYMKEPKYFISMNVEAYALSGVEQPEESENFLDYIKGFAEKTTLY